MTDNRTNEPSEAQVEAAAKALRADEGFMAEVHSALEVSWSEYIARLVLEAAGVASQEVIDDAADEQDDLRLHMLAPQEPSEWGHGVIGGDDLLHRLMDTLAYYHCRSVNPKADSPYLGYHAMSEDQREFLRERQREAAEEVVRMWQSEGRPVPSLDPKKVVVIVGEHLIVHKNRCECGADLMPRYKSGDSPADVIKDHVARALCEAYMEGKLSA